jgi:F-box protein 18 (helicase)
MGFKLTKEQRDVLKAVKDGVGFLKINAFAGTGKTTTLIEIAKQNKDKKILYLAFNRAIQQEAQKKFPKNVEVKTTHALAFKHIVRALDFKVRNDYKITEIAEILEIDDYAKANGVNNLFNNFCNSSATFNFFMKKSKDEKYEELKEYVLNFFRKMQNKEIEVTHSFYLKLFHLKLAERELKLNYDILLLDEAQDINPVTLAIFKYINANQKIVVGDKHQQIYAFRGAINLMNRIKADTYYLTNSFRFNEEIGDVVSKFLKLFKGESERVKGLNCSKSEIKSEAYISRTNAKLIEIIDELNHYGVFFKTIRSPKEIFELPVNTFKILKGEEFNKRFYFVKKLFDEYRLSNYDDFATFIDEKIGDKELLSAVKIAEKFDKRLFDLYEIAKENFNLEKECNIFLTTAHTSKGLEFDKVVLLDDFSLEYNIAKFLFKRLQKNKLRNFDNYLSFLIEFFTTKYNENDLELINLENELNLYYVSITRAKSEVIDRNNLFDLLKEDNLKSINDEIDSFFTQLGEKIG